MEHVVRTQTEYFTLSNTPGKGIYDVKRVANKVAARAKDADVPLQSESDLVRAL